MIRLTVAGAVLPIAQGMAEQRKRVSFLTEFRAGGVTGSGKVKNVSPGGLFVNTASIPQQGDSVFVSMNPGDGRRVAVTGMVWWTTDGRRNGRLGSGFGLRVLEESESYQALVDRLR